jgi:tRNA A-37 threonylcarbamoyl transferase component Bud32
MVLLALAVLTVVVLAFPAPGPTSIDSLLTGLVKALPGLFGWFWELAYDLLLIWTLVLVALALFARGRKRLLFEELLAGALAVGLALVAGWLAGTDWSESVKAVAASGGPPIYLAVRLALATAVVVMASPYMARPFRYLGRLVVGIGAAAGIALGTALPIGMVAAFAVGIGSAAVVHLLFGSPAGRLTLDQVADALAELGVEAGGLRQAPLEPRGVEIVTAEAPGGRLLLVKVYGRDAWDGQLLASAWSSLWYRGDTPHLSLGRRQQVEHEAFVTLLAERAGVWVLPVVAAGMAAQRDALLVTEATGRPLETLGPHEVDDELLDGIWRNAARLHALGVAHRGLDASRIVVRPDGAPAFGDFAGGAVAADDADIAADRAQVLVATALGAGLERAAAAALAALGTDALQQVLPLLQPAAVERQTRHAVAAQDWDLDDLRKACAEASGVELPKLAQLRRVSLRSLGVVILIGLVAYAIISAVADVGLANLIEEFKAAELGWLAVALALSPVVPMAKAFATLGASFRPLRFGPVLMLDYATQFIALAVPSSAARLALDIRFFGRNGIDAGGAVSISAITSVCGFVVQILLIAMIGLSGLASLELGGSDATATSSTGGSSSSDGYPLLVLTAVLVVAGVIVTVAVPKYRTAVRLAVPRYRAMLRSQASSAATALRVLRSPSRVGMIFAGKLGGQLLQVIILGLCLRAFGYHATMAELILVNSIADLFGGVHAGARWHGSRRGCLHRRAGRPGRPQRPRDVHRDRLPDGHLLPPTDLGGDRHALAATALVSVGGALAGSFRAGGRDAAA